MTTVALITSGAYTLANFRGPLIRELVERGIRVLALAPDFDDRMRGDVRALGAEPVDISLQRTGMHPLRDMMDTVRLTSTLKRLKPDVVLSYFAKPVIYGSIAAAIAGVPRRVAMLEGLGYVFNDADGPLTAKRRLLRRITQTLYAIALRTTHKVIFLNREDAEQFTDAGLLKAEKGVNIGGIGVDLDAFQPLRPALEPVTFLLMARMIREKGIREFADAARIVRQQYPAARFVLLGGLDDNPSGLTEAEIRAWVDEGTVEWPGHVNDVRAWLERASVLVLPSYYREGVPRSIQEGMAMARPIITTDNVGCRDTVDNGVNGFLVPVRDVESLAEAMRHFIVTPKSIVTMGQASRLLAEERFDAKAANRRILDIILDSSISSGNAAR